jgi:hypothetical protein
VDGLAERLARAKHYLAIAESQDSKREAYWKAAEDIIAAFQAGDSYASIDRELGRKKDYSRRLADWRRAGAVNGTDLPFTETGPRRVTRDGIAGALADETRRDAAAVEVAKAMEEPEVARAIVKAATPKVRRRILDAEREQVREEAEAVDTYVPSDDSHQVTTFQDLLRKLKAKDLPARIMGDTYRVLNDLDELDQFRFDYGHEVFDDDNGVEVTVNEFLDGVLEDFGGRLQIAFAAAKGAPDNAEDV